MKNKQDNANQRGSALLLTLGVLSLALILAMAFAFSSRSSRLIAKVNADMIKAKLLAQSGLTRLMAAMYYDTNATPGFYIARKTNNLPFTGTITDSGSGATVRFLSMGADTSAVGENNGLFDTLKKHCKYVDSLPAFTPEPVGFQTITSGGKIIGRIGFVVLEESGKIDLNQVLNLRTEAKNIPFVQAGARRIYSGTDSFNATNDFYYNIPWDYKPATTQVTETNTLRMGLHMQELRVAPPYLSALPATSATTRKAQWMSYEHLLNSIQYAAPNKTTFNDDILRYTFFSGEEPEAYWDQSAETATPGTGERQRFDITGYEWRPSTSGAYYAAAGDTRPNPANSGWQRIPSGNTNASIYARRLADALRNASQPFWDTTVDPPEPATVNRNQRVAHHQPTSAASPGLNP